MLYPAAYHSTPRILTTVFVPSYFFGRRFVLTTQTKTHHFMGRVRARDGKCVVTGIEIDDDDFDGFEAAHIFPMAHLDLV
jgi:hypothetical protein